ncbi:MAG: efflux RND transporter permease subunit [Planctomycetes bacterium]|nr:efflux RND transporter permease subunit [Planctomycetota bacterium]
MLTSLIKLSIENRFLVLVLTFLMAAAGVYSALHLPIDAVPDMTNTQVTVITTAGALSPLEVERYITYPVEWTMAGLPRLEQLRSTSQFGLSLVTIVFQDGTDIYWARNVVSQRLGTAKDQIPPGYGEPELGPMATALGEILQFEVRGAGYTPMQLRSLLDWEIGPQLRGKGVTEINAHGGFFKSYEVRPDPNRMATFNLSLEDIFEALEQNNLTAGGGYVDHFEERRFIRGQALLADVSAIEDVVVHTHPGSVPLLIRDVADVTVAPLLRHGAVTRDGRGEAVTGLVMMLYGENSREVVKAVKERLENIKTSLPEGVTIDLIYDRASLVERTLNTVLTNLTEGGILVIVVLLFTLGSFRAGLIVALAIPLSMLFAANLMALTGITASLMSLGAIDFGLIVDSSVIMIENCIRRLAHPHNVASHDEIVLEAAVEVRAPTMFGELIISVVYLPVLMLQGTEGKLFRPMAWTVLFALLGSLILSMTLMPVLATLGLRGKVSEKEVWLIRFIKWMYVPLLERALRHRVVTIAAAAMVFLCSILFCIPGLPTFLGGEFMPKLEEGDLLVEAVRLPTATLEGAEQLTTQIEKLLLKNFPEVRTVFCKTGRPEIASDVMGVHQTDVWVMLKPERDWPQKKSRDQLSEEIKQALDENISGAMFGISMPIKMRVDELVAGVKADVAVLVYGDDLELLARKGKEIERVLSEIEGAKDVKANIQGNLSTLSVYVKPDRLAKYGINAKQVMDAVATFGGRHCGLIFEGHERYPIVVRIPAAWRKEIDLLGQIPVSKSGNQPVMLGELADIKLEETPPVIDHEASRRRTFISANVRGRDVVSFVREAQAAVRKKVDLAGHVVHWGGEFEHFQSASLRLVWITPIVLLVIVLLLYTSVRSMELAALIFLCVPMAASGGVYALLLRGMPFSISAGVGFIALFGVAVLNGLVWVSGAEHLRAEGRPLEEAAEQTAVTRLRPILMTATVASFGFLPMALSTTPGAEIQQPLATVVIGGIITSTMLTTLVLPTIYPWFCPRTAPLTQETIA